MTTVAAADASGIAGGGTAAACHPALAEAFAALDAAGARWCLLRGAANLADPAGDVDMVIDARDLERAVGVLTQLGYVGHRSWGRATHRFLLTYDAATDRWLKLDFVTELAFDPRQAIRVPGASAVLDGRRRTGIIWRPAPADQFWALLLHCMLDKGTFTERHRRELHDLLPTIHSLSDRFPAWLDPLASLGGEPDWMVAAVQREAWSELVAGGRLIRRAWARRYPIRFAASSLGAIALRRATRAVGPYRGGAPVIALVGPDGSGKSTLAAALAAWWPDGGRTIHLGLYGRSTRLSRRGRLRRVIGARAAVELHRRRGHLVVLDRHPLEEPTTRTIGARLRKLLAPSVTLAIVLDAPTEVLADRRADHAAADLEGQRRRYRRLAEADPGLIVVPTVGPEDATRRRVAALVWAAFTGRSVDRATGLGDT